MKLEENISKIRKDNNLSQEELAKMLKVSFKTVYDWESGTSIPNYEMLKELAKCLKVNKENLLDGDIKKKYMYTLIGCNKKLFLDYIANDNYSYLWAGISNAIEGSNAIRKFNDKKINDVYIFFDHDDIIIERKNLNFAELLKIIDEVGYYDCYVVNKNFTWTFIMTHEIGCWDELYENSDMEYVLSRHYYQGPFFKSISNNKGKN